MRLRNFMDSLETFWLLVTYFVHRTQLCHSDIIMSRPSDHEVFDQFFAPLVGTEADVAALRTRLADEIHDDHPPGMDAYDSLGIGLSVAVRHSLVEASHSATMMQAIMLHTIGQNALFCMSVLASGIRTVGDIYAHDVTAPQHPTAIRRSIARVLGQTYSVARAGGETGSLNHASLRAGVSPTDLSEMSFDDMVALVMRRGRHGAFSRDAFIVAQDGAGQLDIRPRYAAIKGAGAHPCPATRSIVEHSGRRHSALLTLMKATGMVALTDIFPDLFAVVEDEDTELERLHVEEMGRQALFRQ